METSGTIDTISSFKPRRISPALIANEIVSVQPMTNPCGEIFLMDFEFKEDVFKEAKQLEFPL